MALTRRNAIVGLGALVGGTGALAASGAFTTVEAERSVSIDTAGDDDALLEITVNDDFEGVSGSGGDSGAIEFEFGEDTGLNENAITSFDGAIIVTPQGSEGEWDISISGTPDGLTIEGDEDNVGPGQSVEFDVTIDLTDGDDPDGGTITIEATRSD